MGHEMSGTMKAAFLTTLFFFQTFNGRAMNRSSVHFYPSLQEFHDAIGWSNAPDGVVGFGNREIYAVSHLNP